MLAVYVFIGGGIGSLVRYGLSLGMKKAEWNQLPWATLICNVAASLMLGIIVALLKNKIQHSEMLYALLVIGFCGGFSTFSSFAAENLDLFQKGHYIYAIANILVSVSVCIFAVLVGQKIG